MTSLPTRLVLVDSNILIYSVDVREAAKQRLARLALDRLTMQGRTAISVQCLTEFFSVTTQQFKELLTPTEARIEIRGFAASFRVLDLTAPAVLEATRVAERHSVPIWDALI